MAISIQTTRVASSTSNGTQDITITDFGTPKAAMFIITKGVTDNTSVDGAVIATGFTDGTRNVCGDIAAKHGDETTVTRSGFSTSACISMSDDTGNLATADFDSWITDGVRIDWTNAPPSAYLLTVVLFGGDDLTAYASFFTSAAVGNTADITDPGFQPTDLITVFEGNPGSPSICIGAVHDDGASTVTQASTAYTSRNSRTAGENAGESTATYGAFLLRSDGLIHRTQSFNTFDANGFSATCGGTTTGDDEIIYLALKIENHDSYVGTFSTPTSTGNDAQTDPGFKPQFLLQLPTKQHSTRLY